MPSGGTKLGGGGGGGNPIWAGQRYVLRKRGGDTQNEGTHEIHVFCFPHLKAFEFKNKRFFWNDNNVDAVFALTSRVKPVRVECRGAESFVCVVLSLYAEC